MMGRTLCSLLSYLKDTFTLLSNWKDTLHSSQWWRGHIALYSVIWRTLCTLLNVVKDTLHSAQWWEGHYALYLMMWRTLCTLLSDVKDTLHSTQWCEGHYALYLMMWRTLCTLLSDGKDTDLCAYAGVPGMTPVLHCTTTTDTKATRPSVLLSGTLLWK